MAGTAQQRRAFEQRLAFQRFGLGSKGDGAAGEAPREACLAEISAEAARIRATDLPDTARGLQVAAELQERRRERREVRRDAARTAGGMAPGMESPAMNPATTNPATVNPSASAGARPAADPDPIARPLRELLQREVEARFRQGLAAPVGFAERWVAFWSNHFCVALRRGPVMQATAGAFEREAIRAHAFGRFEEMLVAVETHPAMLHYLDQRQSIGPNSAAGRRRSKGLNENLAREILELHTLGVGGGYSQADVTAFARVLTGWSISGMEELLDGYGCFVFAPNRHEPGAQTILGKRYPDAGKEQGIAVLRDLAAHPSTATFLATKLARHFVADQPPADLVARLARRYRESRGDLADLARALLTDDAAWSAPATKLRTPYEFLLAAMRATGHVPDRVPPLVQALNLMGQPLWNPPGPNGHPDDVASLAAPKAIKTRLDLAQQWARPVAAKRDPRELAVALYGEGLSNETRTAIARAETRPQGLAILMMSPEFQRR